MYINTVWNISTANNSRSNQSLPNPNNSSHNARATRWVKTPSFLEFNPSFTRAIVHSKRTNPNRENPKLFSHREQTITWRKERAETPPPRRSRHRPPLLPHNRRRDQIGLVRPSYDIAAFVELEYRGRIGGGGENQKLTSWTNKRYDYIWRDIGRVD